MGFERTYVAMLQIDTLVSSLAETKPNPSLVNLSTLTFR